MASEPLLAAYPMAVVQRGHFEQSSVLFNFWTLTKAEINFLIGLATAAARRLLLASVIYLPSVFVLQLLAGV